MPRPDEAQVWFVYFAELADGRFYVGHTNDIKRRAAEHEEGKRCTRTTHVFGFVRVVYHEEFADKATALARERQLKRWSHTKKLALVSDNLSALKSLAKCRSSASRHT